MRKNSRGLCVLTLAAVLEKLQRHVQPEEFSRDMCKKRRHQVKTCSHMWILTGLEVRIAVARQVQWSSMGESRWTLVSCLVHVS